MEEPTQGHIPILLLILCMTLGTALSLKGPLPLHQYNLGLQVHGLHGYKVT